MSKCRYDLLDDCYNKDCLTCILNKITAEIESIEHYATNNGHDIWLRTPDEIKKDVLAILDKYKYMEKTEDQGD